MAFNPLRICHANDADIGTIGGLVSVISLPLSNLQTDDIQQVWRSAEILAQQALVVDLTAQRQIGVVALVNINVFSPSTFHVRVSTSDPTGLDGDAYSLLNIPGVPDPVHNKFVHFLEPQVIGRYVRITMNSLTVSPQAGRLVIGPTWAPTHDMRYGFEPRWQDKSTRTTSLGGNEFVDLRFRQRGWRFTISALTEAEAYEQVDALNRNRGTSRDVLVSRDKDSSNPGRDTMWGLLAEPVTQRKIEGGYEIEVEIWDRV
jgi:hypothetical protein